MRSSLLSCIMAVCLIGPAAARAESVDLRPKFAADRVTHYRNTAKSKESVNMAGQAMEGGTDIDMGIRMKVLKVLPDGGAEVELTYMYVAFDGSTMGMAMKHDSRKPKEENEPSMISGIGGIVGVPLVLTVSPGGQVSSIVGLDKLYAAAAGAMFVQQLISEETLKDLPMFATRNAPNPVEVGGKWEDQSEIEVPQLGGSIVSKVNYALKGVSADENTADIAVESTLSLTHQGGAVPPGMIKMDQGKSTGRMTWDLATGELLKSHGETDTVISFSTAGGGGEGEGGGKMTQKLIETTERVSLKDLNLPSQGAAPAERPDKKE